MTRKPWHPSALDERQRERSTIARRQKAAERFYASPEGRAFSARCEAQSAIFRAELAEIESANGDGMHRREAQARALRLEERDCGSLGDLVALGVRRGVDDPHLWAAGVWRARR